MARRKRSRTSPIQVVSYSRKELSNFAMAVENLPRVLRSLRELTAQLSRAVVGARNAPRNAADPPSKMEKDVRLMFEAKDRAAEKQPPPVREENGHLADGDEKARLRTLLRQANASEGALEVPTSDKDIFADVYLREGPQETGSPLRSLLEELFEGRWKETHGTSDLSKPTCPHCGGACPIGEFQQLYRTECPTCFKCFWAISSRLPGGAAIHLTYNHRP